MRIFVAGSTGVIGNRILPLLVMGGHEVVGMTRSEVKLELINRSGARGILCDVYDYEKLKKSIANFHPDLIIDQLTDLPDRSEDVPEYARYNNRIRIEGTANLLSSASASGHPGFIVQSVAWKLQGNGHKAVTEMEKMVLDYGGSVFRYGQLYGPGTFYETEKPAGPRIHVDGAAELTVKNIDSKERMTEIVESSNPS